ncbi:hypothetical protein PACTADRAFT_45148 [Pachysolen tannophilus NRRL Y-2460]|uniref:Coenzyme Q-binding protein COQ10 START domain-containing protein n=1 Tax=Pachysolen tannophilus NRRL Y-2460 TaxID=669874 RepID=A0A1E4TRQ0_PACTA|nr:hypothetical protein PACTADRAFT_45148 [Pachysolen tannophilus NRRL Y-2460]
MIKSSISRSLQCCSRRSFISIPNLSADSCGHQKYVINKRLNHPVKLMYEIISQVDKYEDFIPYCTNSFIEEKDPVTGQPSRAGLRVGFKQFDERFVCDLKCVVEKQVIAQSVTHSLFNHLYSEWNINPLKSDKQCEIQLILKYDFKNNLYNKISSLFASKISQIMLKAFEQRAIDIRKNNSLSQKL